VLYARLGEKEQALEWLEKAYAEHSDGMVRLKKELAFDNLRSDPRFKISFAASGCCSSAHC
jgi:hypothetical protein